MVKLKPKTQLERASRRADIASQEAGTIDRLAHHAGAIRALGRQTVSNIVAIGKHLIEAQELCKESGENFGDWLKREFEWSVGSAYNFIRVAEMSKIVRLTNLQLPLESLYLLARPSTSEEAREAVVEAAKDGNLTHAQVKEMIADVQAKEVERHERALAKLVQKHEKQIDDIRAEFEGSLTPKEITDVIKEKMAPYAEKIQRYKEYIKKLEKAKPRRPDPHGLNATHFSYALEQLAETMHNITPEQLIETRSALAHATEQTLAKVLTRDMRNVDIIIPWLSKFVKLTGDQNA